MKKPSATQGAKYAFLAALVWLVAGTAALATPRNATVTLSNGEVIAGKVSITPGSQIRLYVGEKQVRNFGLEGLARIEFEAEVEKMQHKYVKGEIGRGIDPIIALEQSYPLREFLVHAEMRDGARLSGAFGTVVFYVQAGGGTQKYVVMRKQTGKVGQKLEDIVYIRKIEFHEDEQPEAKAPEAPELDEKGRIMVRVPSAQPDAELYALSYDKLTRLKPEKTAEAGAFKMEWPLGESAWFAVHAGNRIAVGWPNAQVKPEGPEGEALWNLTNKFLHEEPNFFTVRQLLAICGSSERRDTIYSLVILTREEKKQWAEKPWRLSIWKWKYDSDAQTMRMLGEGMFFRIGDTTKAAPPEVELSGELHRVKRGPAEWVVGAEKAP